METVKLVNERPLEGVSDKDKHELIIINDVISTYNSLITSSNITTYMVYKLWAMLAAASKVSEEEKFSIENSDLIKKLVSEFENVCKNRGLAW